MANVTNIGKPILLGSIVPNIDSKYGPYNSKDAAIAALGMNGQDCICVGLTVGIIENNKIVEYWFQGGTSEENLIKKSPLSIVELKDLVKDSVIPEHSTFCLYTYNANPVNSVPCNYEGSNYILVPITLLNQETNQIITKVYVFAGKTLIEIYDNDIPNWIKYYIPANIAQTLIDLENRTTWS